MKKVLFLIPTLTQTNGVAAFMINYFNKFDLKKFEIEIIYHKLRPSETYINFFKEKGIKIYELPYVRDVGFSKYKKSIKDFFRNNHDYDLIYSNVSYKTYFFYKEAKKYGIKKYAIHAHATQSSDNRIKNIIGNIIQKKVNKISDYKFACSKLAGKAIFKNDDFEVINNAIDYRKYKFDKINRDKIRKNLNINNNITILGFVGRYTPQKNVFFFIELIKKLPDEYKVLMIGNGQQKEEFVKRVNEEKIKHRFIFLEETSRIYEYYSVFDYFLLPSLYEGLPFVSIEAQANGLPCLLSNTISEECKISNNLVYLNKDKIDDWIDQINKMSRNNEIELSDEFNINIQAKKFENKIDQL